MGEATSLRTLLIASNSWFVACLRLSTLSLGLVSAVAVSVRLVLSFGL